MANLDAIMDLVGLSEGCVIADIGCGKGILLSHLLKTNPKEIIAVDISSEMIKEAKQLYHNPRIIFLNEDVLTAPLPMLDAAILFNSYPHFLNRPALLHKLAAHVRQGGILVIAHSLSKEQINEVHQRKNLEWMSITLKPAQVESEFFHPFFYPNSLIDSESFFLIKMTRNTALSYA